MPRAPFLISAAVVAATVAMIAHLGVDQDALATSSAVLVSIGAFVFGLVSVGGLLLSRGRWSRHLAIWVLVAHLVLAAVTGLGPWAWVVIAASASGLFGLTGPWLQGWTRGRAAAMGPGTRPVLLLIGTLAVVPALGIADPAGIGWGQQIVAVLAATAAWAYSRASMLAAWSLRLLSLPSLAFAAAMSPVPGAFLLVTHGLALTYLAWSEESLRAAQPLLDRVYGARSPRPLDPRAGGTP